MEQHLNKFEKNCKGHEENFGSDRYIHYLNCGDSITDIYLSFFQYLSIYIF